MFYLETAITDIQRKQREIQRYHREIRDNQLQLLTALHELRYIAQGRGIGTAGYRAYRRKRRAARKTG